MRVGCILINSLPLQVELKNNQECTSQPLVIGGLPFESRPVLDASPAATACGVKPGMPLRQAYALCPEARFLPADEEKYAAVFEDVLGILENYSPLVDVEESGCACIDISGVADEARLARDITDAISAGPTLSACLGISSSKFVSRLAAITSQPGTPVIVTLGGEKDFVAPFSIDFLPCSAEVRERLRLLGIRFIGQLRRFSGEALAAQFGNKGNRICELANGVDRSPLVPRRKADTINAAVELESPATIYLQILHSCQAMLEKPLDEVRARGKLCSEVSVRVNFTSCESQEKRLVLKEATVSISTILDRLRIWLENISFPAPVTGVHLSLRLVGEQGKKIHLWQGQGKRHEVAALANDLKTRFGYQPLKKVEVLDREAIIPERRFSLTELEIGEKK